MLKDVLTTMQAARCCKTSQMTISRWIKSGKIKAYKTPGGHNRIIKEDLFEFMKENDMPIPEELELFRKNILIVDDDEEVRDGIANYLRMNSFNFQVATAEDGYEAGLMVSQFKPDLIVLDLVMPKMDGFKVCEKIKRNPLTKNIKLLVLTGYANKKNIKRAYDCGADKVLSKPVEMEQLYEEIKSLM